MRSSKIFGVFLIKLIDAVGLFHHIPDITPVHPLDMEHVIILDILIPQSTKLADPHAGLKLEEHSQRGKDIILHFIPEIIPGIPVDLLSLLDSEDLCLIGLLLHLTEELGGNLDLPHGIKGDQILLLGIVQGLPDNGSNIVITGLCHIMLSDQGVRPLIQSQLIQFFKRDLNDLRPDIVGLPVGIKPGDVGWSFGMEGLVVQPLRIDGLQCDRLSILLVFPFTVMIIKNLLKVFQIGFNDLAPTFFLRWISDLRPPSSMLILPESSRNCKISFEFSESFCSSVLAYVFSFST